MVNLNENALSILTKDAPAALADAPADYVSDRYTFVPTHKIVTMLSEMGWDVARARQGSSRVESPEHAPHVVYMRHGDFNHQNFGVGDSVPELQIHNAHNARQNYLIAGGIFRFICTNGMVVGDLNCGIKKVAHRDITFDTIMSQSTEVISETVKASEMVQSWRKLTPSSDFVRSFAKAAGELRWIGEQVTPDTVDSLLSVRRQEDNREDFWTTFNVVQENLTKGGFRPAGSRRVAREITNIQRDHDINANLWNLAMEMAG